MWVNYSGDPCLGRDDDADVKGLKGGRQRELGDYD